MGQHFIPQYYLQGFSDIESNKEVTVYFKKEDKFRVLPIKKVAQKRNFYSDEIEKYMANDIEYPAKQVFGKIKQFKKLTEKEKEIFSKYLVVIIKRVPSHLLFYEKNGPNVIEPIFQKYESLITEMISKGDISENLGEKRLLEIKELREIKSKSILFDTWLNNIGPEGSPTILKALLSMTWTFCVSNGEECFITSDNPFFYFKSIGIGKENSEFSFPVSKKIALWGTWRIDIKDGGFFSGTREFIREINHRTVINSSEFVFSHKKVDYIRSILTRS